MALLLGSYLDAQFVELTTEFSLTGTQAFKGGLKLRLLDEQFLLVATGRGDLRLEPLKCGDRLSMAGFDVCAIPTVVLELGVGVVDFTLNLGQFAPAC